jgi:hypothetical protein
MFRRLACRALRLVWLVLLTTPHFCSSTKYRIIMYCEIGALAAEEDRLISETHFILAFLIVN